MFQAIRDFLVQFVVPFSGYQKVGLQILFASGFVVAGLAIGFVLKYVTLYALRWSGVSRLLDRFFEVDINHRRYHPDLVVARALSWFVFTVALREGVQQLGFADVERFLDDLVRYLPSLFLAIMIGFFGIRFSNTVYEFVHSGFKYYEDEQTAKVLAVMGKAIVLFFTFMIILNYARIVDQFVINVVFVGFVSTMSLAFGLAFGLGGKDFARELISRLKKRDGFSASKDPADKEKKDAN